MGCDLRVRLIILNVILYRITHALVCSAAFHKHCDENDVYFFTFLMVLLCPHDVLMTYRMGSQHRIGLLYTDPALKRVS